VVLRVGCADVVGSGVFLAEQVVDAVDASTPEFLVVVEHDAGVSQTVHVRGHDPASTDRSFAHQARPLEHGHMLLDRGEAHRVQLRELRNAELSAHRPGQDVPARGIGQGPEDGVGPFVGDVVCEGRFHTYNHTVVDRIRQWLIYDRSVITYLSTERMLLRRFTLADLDALESLDADPEVMRFINGGRPTPRAELRDEVLPFWLEFYERGDAWGFWAATERSSDAFLGWFHLRPGSHGPAEEPELGYRLRRELWGRGLATEGSRALIDKAFVEFGVSRVHATTMAVNLASRRVMEKAGMRFVRLFHGEWPDRIPGDEHGDVEYAITREEWEASRSGARPPRES
jgi:RimJ/RimL family protein N-acetyltransferase